MSSLTFPDRQSFLSKNISIQSYKCHTDYTICIDDLIIILNIEDSRNLFIHINKSCDFLAIHNMDTVSNVIMLFNEFKNKITRNEKVHLIYVTNIKL